MRFELQQIQNPEISPIEYQRGELFGFELKEYLLHNWGVKFFYCGAENIPLEIEHIIAKSKGGFNLVRNLTLPCHSCNQAKGNKPLEECIKKKPNLLKRVLVPAKASLKDAAVANVKRWELYRPLQAMGCIC